MYGWVVDGRFATNFVSGVSGPLSSSGVLILHIHFVISGAFAFNITSKELIALFDPTG